MLDTGGLAAVAFTDALQVNVMFFCGIIIVGLGISELGGHRIQLCVDQDNPDHLSVALTCGPPSVTLAEVILGLGIVLSLAYWIASQAILQRNLGAKSQWDASASMMFAAFAQDLRATADYLSRLAGAGFECPYRRQHKALRIIKNVLPPSCPDSCLSRSCGTDQPGLGVPPLR